MFGAKLVVSRIFSMPRLQSDPGTDFLAALSVTDFRVFSSFNLISNGPLWYLQCDAALEQRGFTLCRTSRLVDRRESSVRASAWVPSSMWMSNRPPAQTPLEIEHTRGFPLQQCAAAMISVVRSCVGAALRSETCPPEQLRCTAPACCLSWTPQGNETPSLCCLAKNRNS